MVGRWGDERWGRGAVWFAGVLELEAKLQEEFFSFLVPVTPETMVRLVNFTRRNLEGDGFIRLRGKEQILPLPIWRFYLLFVGRHEPVPGCHPLSNLRIVHLKQQRLLPVLRVSLLGHPVTGPTYLDELLDVYTSLLRSWLNRSVLGLLGSAPGQVRLMLLTLSVRQVAGLIVVKSETELAFISSQMVPHEIRIFLQINRLSR